MPEKLSEDNVALLNSKVLAHVATVMADCSPQVTPVWVDTDGEAVIFNTAKGRVKYRNIEREPRVAVSVVDRDDPYRTVVVRGQAELIDEGADAHIDKLAKKYLNLEKYPHRTPSEVRVIYKITPHSFSTMG